MVSGYYSIDSMAHRARALKVRRHRALRDELGQRRSARGAERALLLRRWRPGCSVKFELAAIVGGVGAASAAPTERSRTITAPTDRSRTKRATQEEKFSAE